MPTVTKSLRLDTLSTAIDGADQALAELERLSNSIDLQVAGHATALLILERNERDDLAVIKALIRNKPAVALKEIDAAQLAMLTALEQAIDARIRANAIANAGVAIATEILRTAEAIGQILDES